MNDAIAENGGGVLNHTAENATKTEPRCAICFYYLESLGCACSLSPRFKLKYPDSHCHLWKALTQRISAYHPLQTVTTADQQLFA